MAKIHQRLTAQQEDKYVFLFNTAHSVAMHNWSLNDFKRLCKLQTKNGVPIGENYQNSLGASKFIQSIADFLFTWW